ncbi:diguanylate cyclase domain-containing protein [Sulfoacidibacillus ferrooxidans]|uniref:GGDEF domain-containing protein n=1 Tax=Sulfoacidibacillus ferrooxidans TaxID=2005001 RepID=A0A9X2AFV4_9BACL|nr:diguanylate cyclase [Sulfoacidibacillus ferrooxidans]MCI0184857.1 hypothetical protein [Sulfoacidibacillus ferrooxidans]
MNNKPGNNIHTLNIRLFSLATVLIVSQLIALLTEMTYPLTFLWYALSVALSVLAYARGRSFGLILSLIAIFTFGTYDVVQVFVLRGVASIPTVEIVWFFIFPLSGYLSGELGDTVRNYAKDMDVIRTKAEEYIMVDVETGFYNRKFFFLELQEELLRARRRYARTKMHVILPKYGYSLTTRRRYARTNRDSDMNVDWERWQTDDIDSTYQVTLMLIEIRHFSDIEVIYGSEQYSRILSTIVDGLHRCARLTDGKARIDPGLFALILPETSALDSMTLKQRIQETLGKFEIITPSKQKRVLTLQLAFGIVSAPRDGVTPESLLAAAQKEVQLDLG